MGKGERRAGHPRRADAVVKARDEWWTVDATALRFVDRDNEAVAETALSVAGRDAGKVRCTWDYDGTMRVDLTLQPGSGEQVQA